MVWKINYTDTAKQQLKKLDKQTAKIILDYLDERIAHLDNPRSSGKALSGKLQGLWRYRVVNCRIICSIQDHMLCILVIAIGHRKNIYKSKL